MQMRLRFLFYYSLFLPHLSSSQNIGVGAIAPSAKLEVAGAETSLNGKNAAINLINTSSASIWTLRAGAAGTATPTGGFSIGDNLAYRFTITNTGNTGIGTTTPQQMLSVYNGMNIDQNDINDGTLRDALRFGNNSSEGIASSRTNVSNRFGLNFFTDSLLRMTITNQGLIGINNNTPKSRLTIYHQSVSTARGYPDEAHAFMIIDSSNSLGIAALYMGINNGSNRAYITFNNESYNNGNTEPKMYINPTGETTIIGGEWGSPNVPYKLLVAGDQSVEGSLFVNYNKGIIRSTDGTQKKEQVKIVTINTSFAAGETKSFVFTWNESFGGAPDAYVGAVAPGSSGGWAEMIMTVAADNTTGGTLFVYNPKTTSVSPNFNIKIIGIGPQ